MRVATALALAAIVALVPACRRHRVTVQRPVAITRQTIAAAIHRTCLLHEGRVKCVGQLGPRVALAPTSIPGTEGALSLDDAGTFGCVVSADRTVACFGANKRGELGNHDAPFAAGAVPVPTVRDAGQLALGSAHACARLGSGRVTCWGRGRGPAVVQGLDSVVDLVADLETTCAIRRDGSAWCWGGAFGEQLTRLGLAAHARQLSLAPDGGCVAYTDGNAGCFSFSDARGLPKGTATAMPHITHARTFALSDRSRCVLDETRTVACWTPFDTTLRKVEGLSDVAELVAAFDHVCARSTTGETWCWGDDSFGQLGDRAAAAPDAQATPRRIDVPPAKTLVMGGFTACTLGDVVRCFGSSEPPHVVTSLAGTRVLARGRDHTCAIDATSALRCFGLSRVGQLGRLPDAGAWTVAEPTPVPGLPKVVDVVVGDAGTCAHTADGQVWCFGSNASGEFGLGSTSLMVATPTPVPALRGFRRVALGTHHLCAIRVDGTVWCAGSNGTGELGNGRGGLGSSAIPVLVESLDQVVELRVLDNHSCARRDDGAVLCWGTRFRGESSSYQGKGKDWFDTPRLVEGTGKTTSLAVGRDHACVVREGGDVLCWGSNDDGACGAPVDGELAVPRVVAGVRDAVEVRAGERTSCARTATDEIWCWGADRIDVDVGSGLHRAAPVRMGL